MRRFPGRTLEELDNIDMGRLQRALEAQRIERVEGILASYHRKEITNDQISPDVWSDVQAHENLMERYYPEPDDAA
jgi:hypothetical protein